MIFIKLTILFLFLAALTAAQGPVQAKRWYKGNTHTHTANSDGDSLPYDAAKWYREHGYNFVFVTDHEYITNVAPLNDLLGKKGSFLAISGQEVTDSVGGVPYHINGLGLERVIMPNKLSDPVSTLQKNIDDVRAAGGLPQLNHPNFGWALSSAQILKLKNINLIEIYNAHPLVNNLGGGGSPSAEVIWDELLTAGRTFYGIADDDSHTFKDPGNVSHALPGRAWIQVRASELTRDAILSSIERGDFYASTGVEIADYTVSEKGITLQIKTARWSKYRVEFLGRNGRVLKESFEENASYDFQGNEGYVRAKIYESNGKLAWTQPVFVRR